jgi:hypothetical protein
MLTGLSAWAKLHHPRAQYSQQPAASSSGVCQARVHGGSYPAIFWFFNPQNRNILPYLTFFEQGERGAISKIAPRFLHFH